MMWTISPWWDNGNQPELGNNAPAIRPGRSFIEYQHIWTREREDPELKYDPRFLPNVVTFDRKNRPLIRIGVHGEAGEHATVYPAHEHVREAYLQTLDAAGVWTVLSLTNVLKEALDVEDISILSGTFQAEERVAFDASGAAYTVVSTNIGDFLLHAPPGMTTWRPYRLPTSDVLYRIELTATDRPPVIFVFKNLPHPEDPRCLNGAVSLIAPQRRSDGTLASLTEIDVAPRDSTDGPSHSGGADVTVTLGSKTHIVYTGTRTVGDQEGTPQYIRTYDYGTGTLSAPVLLGTTLGTPGSTHCGIDGHNGAAIVADSEGRLHVVLGSHQHPFKYTRSRRPNDSTSWEPAVEIGASETYVGLVVDKTDTLHLVSRQNNARDRLSLHYMRKRRDDPKWLDLGDLVVPKPAHYSNWYHKLTIDRRGVLYLAYFYYSHGLTEDECKAYDNKWSDEHVVCAGVKGECEDPDATECRINAHDPVLLMSGDGGDSWKIATTADVVAPWVRLAAGSPELSDDDGWDDVRNYSTIQTAVVKDELYLLARANKGIATWKFDAGDSRWSVLTLNDPALSDDDGWNDITNYSTIQVAVAGNELYLVAR
ncbi:MAG: BNR-4 repeat-containing protein, partial [Vicinamibacteraceae bacterium]